MTNQILLRWSGKMRIELVVNELNECGVFPFVESGKLKTKSTSSSIDAEIIKKIKTFKDELIEFLTVEEELNAVAAPIERCSDVKQILSLSFAQQRLWFIDQLQGGTPEYNMSMAFEMRGHIQLSTLTAVFREIINRHEVLRSVYVDAAGEAMQRIIPISEIDFSIQELDMSHFTGEIQLEAIQSFVMEEMSKPFNLSEDLMLRVSYLHTGEDNGVLVFNMHHIASDGWSMEVLGNEFHALYEAFSKGKQSPLPELEIQYADYADWQRTHLKGDILDRQLDYWAKQLKEAPSVHSLPLSNERPETKKHEGALISSQLSGDVSQRLQTLAKQHQLTPFMLLHGALSLLFSKHSNSHDIVIGTPVANRMQEALTPLIGFFVNTLVLRTDTNHESLNDYFTHIRQVHLDAQSNQDAPFEQLVERLKIPRSTTHTPLFQIILTTNTVFGVSNVSDSNDESHKHEASLSEVSLTPYQSDVIQSKFDLEVNISIDDRGVGLVWTYDVSLFNEGYIGTLDDHLRRLLIGLSEVTTGDVAPYQLPLLSEAEEYHLVTELNDTAMNYPKDKCIHELFEQQVLENPDKIAVVFEEAQLTYQELNHRANQLAHYLVETQEVNLDTLVGLCAERSLDMVVGILGILKAGGAYVPLDPSYPQQRLDYMIEDAGLSIIVSHSQAREVLSDYTGQVIDLGDKASYTDYNTDNLDKTKLGLTSSHLAYVIYTSGSTGKPKGVLTPHIAVVRLVKEQDFMTLDSETRMMQCANIAFDAATIELWGPLLNSGQVILYPATQLEPDRLNKIIIKHAVNTLWLTAGFFREWSLNIPSVLPLKELLAGGDILDVEAVKRTQAKLPQLQLINGYGPTENTTFSTTYKFNPLHDGIIPIGKRLSSDITYILDINGELVPEGVVGELYVGGDGLARGYLNHPGLTAERFIDNPFYNVYEAKCSERLYRTGDLVRYLPDGNLEFMGRTDDQVKIRGFRIELGEVEAQLSAKDGVDSALAVVTEVAGSQQLVGYIQSQNELDEAAQEVLVTDIKAGLVTNLPNYMIPSILIVVDKWPLTLNGKVDKQRLPVPELHYQHEYSAPDTAIEKQLVTIWAKLLKLSKDTLSVHANFFELGGHSLLATKLVSEIATRLNRDISVKDIFEHNTVEALADFIASQNEFEFESIQRVSRVEPLTLSFSQQRLWFIHQLEGSIQYNMPRALRLNGALNVVALHKAFDTIVDRHEVLRSTYCKEGQLDVQVIHTASPMTINVLDLQQLTCQEQDAELQRLLSLDTGKSFDLSNDLMLRVSLLRLSEQQHALLFNMHHIASDGWSMGIVIRELVTLYSAFCKGLDNPLPPLAVQYADFAHWQRTNFQGETLDEQLSYWQQQLSGIPQVHSVPLDKPRPAKQSFQGQTYIQRLEGGLLTSLKSLCWAHDATLFMVLQSAFALLLGRWSHESDVVMGSPIAGRTHKEVEPLIGFFVNTLVLRTDLSEDISFHELLKKGKQTALDAYAHQDIPFEMLVDSLNPHRSLSHAPLFQVLFTLQNIEQSDLSLPELKVEGVSGGNRAIKFDLELSIAEVNDGLTLNWNFAQSLFEESTISAMAASFEVLLRGIADAPEQLITELPLVTSNDAFQIKQWNQTASTYPKEKCIHELFERQAQQNPDNVAVVFEDKDLTYAELNQKANQLAHYLVEEKQVKPDTLVGICVERSLEMIVGIMAILKAGGAYVPLDCDYPEARLQHMLADANLTTVLTQSHLQGKTPVTASQAVYLDDEELLNTLSNYDISNLDKAQLGLNSNHLAYVIYTSGSTGKPKGVMIEHVNATRLFDSARESIKFNVDDVWAMFHSFAFDFSVWEMFGALTQGGKLIVVSYLVSRSTPDFYNLLVKEKVTVLNQTPSAFSNVINEDLRQNNLLKLRYVIFGGEALSFEILKPWVVKNADEKPDLINMYGITETTVHVTFHKLLKEDILNGERKSIIGRGLSDLSTMVLNQSCCLTPINIAGELYVGGAGLARGYLNQPELTREKFIDNPFYDEADPNSSERLYKTGDLVRWLPDGNLEFIGRVDHQVKIRGFRIELGEIEHALISIDEINDAIVLTKEEDGGDKRLVAYMTHHDTDKLNGEDEESVALRNGFIESLRQSLKQYLPDYMVPSAFVFLSNLPLTANGKINRKVLPEPDFSKHQIYVAPVTNIEKQLVSIWAKMLKLPKETLSITSNFFELGGHSLLATRLVNEISVHFDRDISVRALFENNTIVTLAAILDIQSVRLFDDIVHVEKDTVLPLSFSQQRLWFIDRLGGSLQYNMPMALRLKGLLNIDALQRSLDTIVERHEVLRSVYLEKDGRGIQVVQDHLNVSIVVADLTTLTDTKQQEQVITLAQEEAAMAFNLSEDAMLRVTLLALSEQEYVLLLTLHHIACDGWSMGILTRELVALYDAYTKNEENPLAALAIQYGDFAHWQRNQVSGDVLTGQLEYWQEQLEGIPQVHSLPLDKPRPATQSHDGESYTQFLDKTLLDKLTQLAHSQGATLFMLLQSAFALLLGRWSHESDIVIGSPVAGRTRKEVEPLIGFFINTLVFRNDVSEGKSFTQLLHETREMALNAYAHQDISFEMLVEALKPARSLSHTPVFQVLFSLQNNEHAELNLPSLSIEGVSSGSHTIKFDLTLTAMESEQGLGLSWGYAISLFEQSSIQRLAASFEILLQGIVAAPNTKIEQFALVSEADEEQLMQWEQGPEEVFDSRGIHQLFTDQAAKSPDAIAVKAYISELSYQQLDALSDRLACYLQANGIQRVGIYSPRSPALFVALLGALKAGAAYIPLEPKSTAQRLAEIISDAELPLLLAPQAWRETLPHDAEVLTLDDATGENWLSLYANQKPDSALSAQDSAYIIYTSGSTGKPKGVEITHEGLSDYCGFALKHYYHEDLEGSYIMTSHGFDITVPSLYLPLMKGGTVSLPEPDKEFSSLVSRMQKQSSDGTLLRMTPMHVKVLLRSLPDRFTCNTPYVFVIGGEAFSESDALSLQQTFSQSQIYNHYGPTEAVVGCTMYDVTAHFNSKQSSNTSLSTGRPMSNTQAIVLSSAGRRVPQGFVGELYIGGPCVAKGYIGQPELNQQKFVVNPVEEGNRLYKTGDLVRYRPDGCLEFIGREDHQIKLRGFRVEPGEIENLLVQHSAIKESVVLALGEGQDKQLVAWIVPQDARIATDNEAEIELVAKLRQFMSQTLSDYMCPTAYVCLKSMPLTASGKLSRRELPPPILQKHQHYVKPTSETEQLLVSIWADILDLPDKSISITANFFQLGGHSLLIIRLIEKINQKFAIRLPMNIIYKAPTLSGQSLMIEGVVNAINTSEVSDNNTSMMVEIQPGSEVAPLFLVHPVGGDVLCYSQLVQEMELDCPVYGLQRKELSSHCDVQLNSIEDMAKTYLAKIKQIQAKGPYRIAGWSMGGVIAMVISELLETSGETVSYLGLIDSVVKQNADSLPKALMDLLNSETAKLSDYIAYIHKEPGFTKAFDQAYKVKELARTADCFDIGRMREILVAGVVVSRQYHGEVSVGHLHYYGAEHTSNGKFEQVVGQTLRLSQQDANLHMYEANHYTILQSPCVCELAADIKKALSF
jgi:amino acid adenylation domain-containing protein